MSTTMLIAERERVATGSSNRLQESGLDAYLRTFHAPVFFEPVRSTSPFSIIFLIVLAIVALPTENNDASPS